MSEATSIDKLSIEIESNSANAAQGIGKLAEELGKLKSNGSIGVACKNLERLSEALKKLTPVTSNASKLSALADSITKLSGAGSIASVVNQLGKLPGALKGLSGLNIDNSLGSELEGLARSMAPLAGVKAGGIGTIANALTKLQNIDLSKIKFEDTAIEGFVAEIKKLDDAIGPLSTKMTAISKTFNVVNSSARSAGSGMSAFDGKVKTTRLNLANLITVIQGVKSALMPLVRLLSMAIGDAMEWDGIAYQFGNAFGEQADEYYEKITKITDALMINKQTFMESSAMATSMLKGFGVGSEDAREMGVGYTELAYDIWAAFNNVYKSLDGADGAMAAVRSAIAGEVEPIRRAGFTIVESQLEITAANNGIAYSSEKATEAQKSYLRYLTLVEQATTKGIIGAYAYEMKMNTAEALTRTLTQQVKSLSQAFGSLFLPILVKVMPWLQAFVTLLTEAIYKAAAFFGIDIQPAKWNNSLGGGASGLEGVGDAAETAADSLGNAANSAGKAKKAIEDLKKATIGIDELNVISPPTENSGSGGSGGSGGGVGGGLDAFEGMDIGSIWDDSIFNKIQFEVDGIIGKVKEALSAITAVISGFMLAVGTILVVSGANIPLGLALMAAGAVGLVASISENWSNMSDKLAKTLTTVTAVVGGFLLAIGAFLAFSGVNVGLGAALMVAGAVSLGTAATINWKFLEGDMKNTLSILTGIVAGGLLAMGALFAFTGVDMKLGIGLMLAGAVGLATAAGLNWDSLSEPMRKAIGTLEAIVGGGLLTFGAILALTGANIPLGVGMIAAGAVSLASATVLNWDSLTGDLKNTIATITALVSGALIGIGAILTFTGVATPLGIAMIAAGAVGIVASAAVNWRWIVEKIKNVLKEIGIAVGAAFLALGILFISTGVALPLGIALLAAGAASLVTGATLNSDAAPSQVETTLSTISIIAGLSTLALGVILVCSGVALPTGIALIASGASGLVSGVTLKWDSISTSIQDAFNKIQNWVSTYGLLALGVILCLTGVGIPLGLSLIKQGLNKKTDSGSTVGDDLLKTIQEKWNAITTWWNSKPALKAISVKVDDLRTKVSNAWSSVKSWWKNNINLETGVKLVKNGWTSVKSWVGNIPVVSQAIKLVKSGWSSVKNWVGSIPTLSAGIKLVKSGWSTVKNWLGSLNFDIGFKLPKIGVNWSTKEVLGFKIKYPSSFYTYAKGGFPDMGEMFVAREAGPEMVGRIGSKTTVANNDQIVEGISEGVYAAVVAAMRQSESGGSQPVNVYLDGKQIYSSMEQHRKERGASLMGSQVYAY